MQQRCVSACAALRSLQCWTAEYAPIAPTANSRRFATRLYDRLTRYLYNRRTKGRAFFAHRVRAALDRVLHARARLLGWRREDRGAAVCEHRSPVHFVLRGQGTSESWSSTMPSIARRLHRSRSSTRAATTSGSAPASSRDHGSPPILGFGCNSRRPTAHG